MNPNALQKLEFHKITARLAELAHSQPGKQLCRNVTPSVRLDEIESRQAETQAALARMFQKGAPRFSGSSDLHGAGRALEIGSVLPAAELLRIADSLDCTARIKSYGRQEKDGTPPDALTPLFDRLEPLTPLAAEIRRCILSEEEFADDASPGLRQVRRAMAQAAAKVHSQLGDMVNGSCRAYLQEAVVTMRDNRYCLPVKSEYRHQVPGIVHDQSSTGSTLFIEPAAVVELNNGIRQLTIREKEEIEQILARLSAEAAGHASALLQNSKTLAVLDFIFAKAALAMEMSATRPLFNTERRVRIRKGRHPLLSPKTVVPIDLRLGEDFDLLIVTGPNTGGKTVSLKTVGLLTLMGQAGLHIPALDRSELAVFHDVYADIGDEQSIEQSLSTFSSHMVHIVSILEQADAHSLCLFDELGAGTDPAEGAALAIAILNDLHRRGIRTMATTHYSELKVYALSTPFAENACCEFDVETLRPTYRLLIGVPGKSNAFAISARLGLPAPIIDAARAQLTDAQESLEDLLADLEQSRVTIERERAEAARYKEEAASLKEQLTQKQEKLEESRQNILREANEQARAILEEAKEVADETIRSFRKAGPDASMKELEKARQNVRGKIGEKNEALALKNRKAPAAPPVNPKTLRPGDAVQIVSMGLKGTVSSRPDHKGNLFVQCGIIRSQVNVRDLTLIEEPSSLPVSAKRTGAGNLRFSKSMHVSPEILLIGKTVDEAIAALDKYLDDACLAHLSEVRIVHGKGTGALRKAVHQHLKQLRFIESFRLGEFGEGDAGVTIAVLR